VSLGRPYAPARVFLRSFPPEAALLLTACVFLMAAHLNRILLHADPSKSSSPPDARERCPMPVTLSPLRLVLFVLVAPLITLATSSCVHSHHVHHTHVRRAPAPPLIASHGYRHHHEGIALVFDRSLHCYVVEGHAHHYFYRDRYYRFVSDRWEAGGRLKGPWVSVEATALPIALRERHVVRDRHRAARERRDERREGVRDRREERRETAKEQRGERREAAKEQRDDHHETAKEQRDERRETAKEQRDERRETAKEQRGERRETAKEQRGERRETAQGAARRTPRGGQGATRRTP
jgi:hypothetical protein